MMGDDASIHFKCQYQFHVQMRMVLRQSGTQTLAIVAARNKTVPYLDRI